MSSIPSYTRPQDSITQILRTTAVQVANRRNALVIGPQHKLLLRDGRALPRYAFRATGASVTWGDMQGGVVSNLDLTTCTPVASSFRLYGEGLAASVTPVAIAAFAREQGTTDQIRLSVGNLFDVSGTASLNTGLGGRSVSFGDVFVVTATNTNTTTSVTRRKVLELLPKRTAASVAVLRRGTTNSAPSSFFTGTANASLYTGTTTRTYVLECTTASSTLAGSAFAVLDTSGADPTYSLVPTGTAQALGVRGLTVTLALSGGSIAVGDKFYFDVTASAIVVGEFNGVRLDGPVLDSTLYGVSGALSVKILQPFDGFLDASNTNGGAAPAAGTPSWSYGALGLPTAVTRLASGFSVFEDTVGFVVPSYKATVLPSATEGIIAIDALTDIPTKLGEINPENWAAQGAFEAFSGGQSQRIYVLRTAGDTAAAFTTALVKVKTNDTLYALNALTDRADVRALVAAHCTEMSGRLKRNFRRSYLGVDSPGKYLLWGNLASGSLRRATLADGVLQVRAEDRDSSNFLIDASVGDTVTIVGVNQELTITQVLANGFEVVVSGAGAATIPTASGFSLYRADSPANTVKYLKEQAELLSNRRAALVWCDAGRTSTQVRSNKFIASEIAGLRVALLPQQGLTMTEIDSITSAPSMYTRFTPEQLDEISAAGVMVVTQEAAGGPVFIRHQLTTETEEGSLAYEDNVGVIVDTFSFLVKDKFKGYTGKRNVTRDTQEDIEVAYKQLALDSTKTSLVNPDVGPLVVAFFNEKGVEGEITIRVDTLLSDHYVTYCRLRVPTPLNGLDHFVDVEVSSSL